MESVRDNTMEKDKKNDIRLIAFDLDGTALNSAKKFTARTADALARAAAAGVYIVPATGRLFLGMPQEIRELPFVRYVITANGSQTYDKTEDRAVSRIEMENALALSILSYLDRYPVVYDAFYNNQAYMTRSAQEHIADYMPDPHYQDMVRRLRKPVPELKAFLREAGGGVQKLQFFVPDLNLKERLLLDLKGRFPETAVTSAVPNNVEINAAGANKGAALTQLAALLSLDLSQTIAFGDGLNDITMIRAAGRGIAMANAHPDVLAAADEITSSCDEDGMAVMLERSGF